MTATHRSPRRPTAASGAAVRTRPSRPTSRSAIATATATAPRPAPTPRARPKLTVVDPRVARRQRIVRRSTVVLTIMTVVSLFALVGFSVLISQHQLALERTQQRTVDARRHYEELRLEVAGLSAPTRIVTEAEQRLGMVEPAQITYLAAVLPGLPRTTSVEPLEPRGWSEVKAHLDDRP